MSNIEFNYPWVFILSPLPLLIWYLVPKASQYNSALWIPFFDTLQAVINQQKTNKQSHISTTPYKVIGLLGIWLCTLIAASDPYKISDPISMPSSGRDLMLAVDISGSMREQDMKINNDVVPRIIAVKAVLHDFLERRKGDRIGLILFGTQAYLQTPLTFDHKTVRQFMNDAQLGFAGPQTAIGDAIGLAIKRIKNSQNKQHVLILLTDGANTAGNISPIAAAKLAKQHNLTVYTVAIGADEMIVPGLFGSSFGARRVNPSADLDEKTLTTIAEITGGQFFRAKNPEELITIYKQLDELEPIESKDSIYRPTTSLITWPLSLGLFISILLALYTLIAKRICKFTQPSQTNAKEDS